MIAQAGVDLALVFADMHDLRPMGENRIDSLKESFTCNSYEP